MTAHLLRFAIQAAVLILLPPLLPGLIGKVKALFAGRVGPPVLQLYYDLYKLLHKRMVLSRTTSWVFLAGPAAGLAAVAVAGLVLPLGGGSPLAFTGDMILFLYLLAMSRFFTTAAALDTGSAFEGMGAVRELSLACLAEPAVMLALLALARFSQSMSLSGMLGTTAPGGWMPQGAALLFVAAGLFIVLLAENCRIPFDDPNTHLELTMIHEVMVLDHSGPALAVILYGAALKLFIFAALLVQIVAPVADQPIWLAAGVVVAGVLGVAAAVGVVESVMARLRLIHVPRLLVTACLLCGFGFLLLVR